MIDFVELSSNRKLITSEIKGCGGEIKIKPEDFIVEEIPLYQPSGEGVHLYITIEKKQINTFAVAKVLSEIYEINEGDVGFAGIKDKEAIATQTFSIDCSVKDYVMDPSEINHPDFKVINYDWHVNKLKEGHLIGNRFKIVIRNAEAGMLSNIKEKTNIIKAKGCPNYFDSQRFSYNFSNKSVQELVLSKRQPFHKKRFKFRMSVIQSAIFNGYLSKRIELGYYDQIMDGDIMKKHDTGGLFTADMKDEDIILRFENQQISPTGPIYGKKMTAPEKDSLAFENDFLNTIIEEFPEIAFIKSSGTRRIIRFFPQINEIESLSNGTDYFLDFSLPKGSYATRFLAELMTQEL